MGTILGLEILERARNDLLDPEERRWKGADLRAYLNDGQREVAILRPDSYVVTRAIEIAVNTTRQGLPSDGTRLIGIMCDMGVDGATPGPPVGIVEREELDTLRPTWHSEAAVNEPVQSYVFDGRTPSTFYSYPKVSTKRYVLASFQAVPPDVQIKGVDGATENTVIALDDLYQTPLYDYVMFRAHFKDTDAQNTQEGNLAYGRFLNRLGLKVQVDRAFDPNRNSPPRETKRGPEDVRPAF